MGCHHSNSRRFICACGRLTDHWGTYTDGDPCHVVVCACGRVHERTPTARTVKAPCEGVGRKTPPTKEEPK